MKAALNRVPSLNVLDGWWIPSCPESGTGWVIGDVPRDPPADTSARETLTSQTRPASKVFALAVSVQPPYQSNCQVVFTAINVVS
jgi:glucan phosphorylase